ncbi:MAG: hypothetical protein M3Z26_10760 [Bacteroidota bacterium]|nr:hypothetical protein [Bacteroidota bacterium]
MTAFKPVFIFLLILTFFSCKKNSSTQQTIAIPNGDFEQWDVMSNLQIWQTNSCPLCVPPYETYVVQKVTDAEHGQFAAKFVYNGVYSSSTSNKFKISLHPTMLTGYIKSNIANGDTAIIHIDLYSENTVIDNGNLFETNSSLNYKKFEIPISQASITIDSALIKIVGGKKQGTQLYVDNLVFIKSN